MRYLGDMKSITRQLIFVLASLATGHVAAQEASDADPIDELPSINRSIVDYALSQEGKKVGTGECWDLAATALRNGGAQWDGMYVFGTIVDWKRDEVLPGDIVQMENVEVEHRSDNMVQRERYGKHTAVIVRVRERGDFTLAHQNVEPIGRKVGLSDLRMSNVRGGKLTFYRPQK